MPRLDQLRLDVAQEVLEADRILSDLAPGWMSRQEHRDRRLPFGADQGFYVRSRKHIGPGVAMGTLVRGRRFRTTPRRALCSRHKKGRSRDRKSTRLNSSH